MSDYEQYRALVADASDKDKLVVLRSAGRNSLTSIRGYAALVYKFLKESDSPDIPDDIKQWCKIILDKANTLDDLIEALTEYKPRPENKQDDNSTE